MIAFVPPPDETTRVTRIDATKREDSSPRRPDGACIVVIYGPEIGHRLPLSSAPFEIGRASKNDLSIDQESISRHHARITYDGGGYLIADLGSTNGTFVNDVLVTETTLRDGDQIQVGRSILKFMTGENIEMHYHEEIYRLMTVDGLTQAYNRRYFNEVMEREYNRSKRYGRDLSLVLFDIDHFKRINDTHGHLAGDAILRQLANGIKPRLRREDIFSRTGGEEFGVLLPEIRLDGARVTAEKVRALVEAMTFKHEDKPVPVTVSLGIAQLRPQEHTTETFYREADEALYAAKRGGRNRVGG